MVHAKDLLGAIGGETRDLKALFQRCLCRFQNNSSVVRVLQSHDVIQIPVLHPHFGLLLLVRHRGNVADAVVVGSVLVSRVAEFADQPAAIPAQVAGIISELRAAMDAAG